MEFKLYEDKILKAEEVNDVLRYALRQLMHENEQLKNELWKAKERLKRTQNEGGNTNGLYVSSVQRIER